MVLDGADDDAQNHDDAGSSSGSDSDSPAIAKMNPLELRFSQKKMRNVFVDGKLIDDTAPLVKAVRRSASETEIYGAPWHLEAPFPPIEVIRWRCKLRDDTTGRPLEDPKTGEQLMEEEESWFTLDNRRLYCLQQAAIRLLPERCTADSTIEIRKDRRMREIRKFRTLDSGNSINIGSVVDGVPFTTWCWRSAAGGSDDKNKSSNGSKGKGRGGNTASKNGASEKSQKGGHGKNYQSYNGWQNGYDANYGWDAYDYDYDYDWYGYGENYASSGKGGGKRSQKGQGKGKNGGKQNHNQYSQNSGDYSNGKGDNKGSRSGKGSKGNGKGGGGGGKSGGKRSNKGNSKNGGESQC